MEFAFYKKIKYNFVGAFCSSIGSFISKRGMQMSYSSLPEILLKVITIAMGMFFNSINLKMFYKSSEINGASTATILSFSFNFLYTNLIEYFVVGKVYPPYYYYGILCMLIGLGFISTEKTENEEMKQIKTE